MGDATRRRLARAAFAHSAGYDAAIVRWLDEPRGGGHKAAPDHSRRHCTSPSSGPTSFVTARTRISARRATGRVGCAPGWWEGAVQHGGREMSYLNLLDAEAAWRLVHELVGPA